MKRYRGAILFGVFTAFAVFVVFLFNSMAAPAQGGHNEGGVDPSHSLPALPDVWGEFRRTGQVRGKEALTEIDRLHNKSIQMTDGLRAEYTGSGGQQFTIWIAGTHSDAEAKTLEEQMTSKIGDSNQMFSQPVLQERGDRRFYRSEGMGQVHFYYATGPMVVWIAVTSPSPDALGLKLMSTL